MRAPVVPIMGLLTLAALGACGGSPSDAFSSPSASTTAGPSSVSPSPVVSKSSSPSPSPTLEPLGRSVAQIRATGDVAVNATLRLATFDSFMAVWCDTPKDCAKAANSLQIMGEDLGGPGRHRTSDGLMVTIELDDRFLYVSDGEYVEGRCVVTFTTSDERGLAGEIVCEDITNGFGVGSLEVSLRGSFVAAY